ncbi:hypothetical protein JEG43_06090 [Anoxybacillus sp. LAT_35]|nr:MULTISPECIES: hypothetical protein [Anoxybacillus]MCG5025481.1 hypothetical protein [Anoxybacillus flavithermus]MCG3083855.1 hypothetical protein [Anoxybacillus sp. LAT27]MCG3085434.1 hypothetical protein [Anoxybacillus sp. LAT27]MCG6170517.1 hypothetical protein [Anoxybacillus sp. LAT_11]MCG6175466.1 hypothetical protein [Anoxybacillus sp. LAT_31]
MDREWIQLMKVIGVGIIVTGYILLFISEYRELEEMKQGGSFSPCK